MEQTIEYKGYKIEIIQDQTQESPNDWRDTDLFLVYQHRNFNVEKEGFCPRNINLHLSLSKTIKDYPVLNVERWEEINDELSTIPNYSKDYFIFPVEAYIHSGVSLSLFNGKKKCMFDSSVTGFILVARAIIDDDSDQAQLCAEGLIENWNSYLSGDVYGFVIYENNPIYTISKNKFKRLLFETDLADLETEFNEDDNFIEIDSCWGFYGDPEKSGLIAEAKSVIDYRISNLNK